MANILNDDRIIPHVYLTHIFSTITRCVCYWKMEICGTKKEETKKKITAKSVLTSAFDFAVTFEAGLTFAHKMGG